MICKASLQAVGGQPVPEPSSLWLLLVGWMACLLVVRRQVELGTLRGRGKRLGTGLRR
ncbi:MAG: PEP-CTERM sorting domain-containing protein [Candidatus Tectomicrobia bacterium]|uniref:PEP-CTERM sorting domain-containing protein n=1 Tax=Tectimicrobiota bacterium TaxID=2528274 RepID=A0A938B1T7_UNCTE|nr:PEP-CTERM sorting domain-containing protein [Candidatus Tectomicrobia bacterium]